jgi:hypothetical protein
MQASFGSDQVELIAETSFPVPNRTKLRSRSSYRVACQFSLQSPKRPAPDFFVTAGITLTIPGWRKSCLQSSTMCNRVAK